MADDLLPIERVWDRQEGEPEDWYRIFSKYYLLLGPQNRSLRAAFEFYLKIETPPDYRDVNPEDFKHIPSHWSEHARRWNWTARAAEYDEAQIPDISAIIVQQTLDYLKANAAKAGQALVDALKNERTRVQAANSILNRIGVPETTELNLVGGVALTSDDMAAAKAKVDEWKTKRSG